MKRSSPGDGSARRARAQTRSADQSPNTESDDTRRRIYDVVRRIPKGRVATYGQVAMLAGQPRQARQVGYALNALSVGSRIPWHRVVNVSGGISARREPGADHLQRLLLEEEGVVFDSAGRLALAELQWRPRAAPRKYLRRNTRAADSRK